MRKHKHVILSDGQGGQIILLEKGARTLHVSANEQYDAALWQNPSALSDESVWNIGGDRTWVSPELEFFLDGDGHGEGEYRIPSQLDPGQWKLEQLSSTHARTSMNCELTHRTSGQQVALQLTKEVELIPNPLSMNSSVSAQLADLKLHYVGYETRTRMLLQPVESDAATAVSLTNDKESADPTKVCNLWSIMQVPPGGEILASTFGNIEPMVMFAQTEQIPMTAQSHYVRIKCMGQHSFKLSIDAISSTGRMGYLRRLDDQNSSLIIRQFNVNPAQVFPDYPPNQQSYQGSCMQFYYDGEQLGHFAELEYHAPAISIDLPGQQTDASQLYYYVGSTDSILAVAQIMLGISI